MSARLAVSDLTKCARDPSSRRAASTLCSFRPVSSTSAPPSSSALTVASPMPCVPPVTTAFLPVYLPMEFSFAFLPAYCTHRESSTQR